MPDTANNKAVRALACTRCQQRKIKCDKNHPCGNCVRLSVQADCTPASLNPRQRRRRFPERHLLDRIRHYESLLRDNKIPFEPLHPSSGSGAPGKDNLVPAQAPTTSDEAFVKDDNTSPGVDFWRVMNGDSSGDEAQVQGFIDEAADDFDLDNDVPTGRMSSNAVRRALDKLFGEGELLLFGATKPNVPLSTLHPKQVDIFRLWQIYLENVDPLFKITHTPTLQTRLLEAASDVTAISPPLEALMFSIYCAATMSLEEDECISMFASPKAALLSKHQLLCQQALQNCRILRSTDLDSITALFLYFVSVRSTTDPRAVASLLGIVIRLAERIGIQIEYLNAKCPPFEAEARRRLWWALALFDNRICEMSDVESTSLTPVWSCRTPLNVNDFDIRAEMTSVPTTHRIPTEALYAVVMSELGNIARHTTSYLDCNGPTRYIWGGRPQQNTRSFDEVATALENKYFALCSPENPLHYMTMWTARALLAKYRLYEYYSRTAKPDTELTDAQRDAALLHAVAILDCDSKLSSSPLTKRFRWQLAFAFPFPSYMHIATDLRKRPLAVPAAKAWKAMSDNCTARFEADDQVNVGFKLFSRFVLQAWQAHEDAGGKLEMPSIVADVRRRKTGRTPNQPGEDQATEDFAAMNFDDFSMSMPMNFGFGPPEMASQSMDVDFNQFFDWSPAAWGTMGMGGG